MPLVKDLALIASGPLAGIINQLGARKVHRWTLTNLDTNETLEGQFGPLDPRETPGPSAYVEHNSLGSDKPITQYVMGAADSFSFGAHFFAMAEDDEAPATKIKVLKQWARRDDNLGRPPVVSFNLGENAQLQFGPAVITSIGDLSYFDPPKHHGGIQAVTAQVTLRQYIPYSVESTPAPETRYHHVRLGDYYELIAYNEYRDPMLGDVIRARNPELLTLEVGDIVPLPSGEALRTASRKPRSLVFTTTLSSQETIQKINKREAFDRHSDNYYSPIIITEL